MAIQILTHDKMDFIKKLFLTDMIRHETAILLAEDFKLLAYVPPKNISLLIKMPHDIIFILFDLLGGYRNTDVYKLITSCKYLFSCYLMYQTRLTNLYVYNPNPNNMMLLRNRYTNIEKLEVNGLSNNNTLILKEISKWKTLNKLVINNSNFGNYYIDPHINFDHIKILHIKQANNLTHRILFAFKQLVKLRIDAGHNYYNYPKILSPTIQSLNINIGYSKKPDDINFITSYSNLNLLVLSNLSIEHVKKIGLCLPLSLKKLCFSLRKGQILDFTKSQLINIINLLNWNNKNKKYITVMHPSQENYIIHHSQVIFGIGQYNYVNIEDKKYESWIKHKFELY